MQNHRSRNRLVKRLVLGVVVAAAAAPMAQADLKTLTDFPPAIAREAAKSYGPLQVHIKTLADYPPAIAREAAKSYGPLQATPSQVVSKPDGFDCGGAAVDMGTVLALVLLAAAALSGTRRKSHPTG
jgi:hypothetical protein